MSTEPIPATLTRTWCTSITLHSASADGSQAVHSRDILLAASFDGEPLDMAQRLPLHGDPHPVNEQIGAMAGWIDRYLRNVDMNYALDFPATGRALALYLARVLSGIAPSMVALSITDAEQSWTLAFTG